MLDGLEKFSLPEIEKKVLKFWEENKTFEKSLSKTKKGKPFTFYDGPPFATGLPHYGHILASTIKDVIPRYQTMRGRFVRRRWGWDCHGLPVEEIVERKLGISGKKQIETVGIKKFNETCRSVVLEYANEWGKVVNRIARWVEFDNSYKTMDADYMESVWWAFSNIYKKKLVYEGRKVLLYCPRCETPISNFEVAMDNSYRDVTEESVYVKFKIRNPGKFGFPENAYVLAWTTTAWTLPGNVALAVGEKIEYVSWNEESGGRMETYIAAKDYFRRTRADKNIVANSVMLAGKSLVGIEYEPLFNVPRLKTKESYQIYSADFVTTEEGTGVVHTAVVYGEDDYNLGVREGLPVVPLLDERGIFNGEAPESLRGMYFKDSEKFIKDDLEKRGLLLKRLQYTHSYPHCWRCGNALFYNAIPAWFVNIQRIRPELLKSNRRGIHWFPEHLKLGRYEKSVEAAPDWNISRNRYWGNPIPVWKCSACDKREVVESIEELSDRAGKPRNNYWVMRHGEAESNVLDIVDDGKRKFHLTPLGRIQAEKSIEKLKGKLAKKHSKIDLIIASDVMRTKETSEIDAEVLGGEKLVIDKRLEEIHLGPDIVGCHDDKYHERFPTYASKFEERPEKGESLRDLRTRLWSFLSECESKYEGKNILVVSHEYPIWMLVQVAEGWTEKRAISEKEKRGDAFIKFAGIEKLDVKKIPRNDTGEVDLHRPYIDEVSFSCASCGKTMKRTPEIFDSWTEAGSMPFSEYHYPFENKKIFKSRLPAQFVAEYIAQTRAWFYVMHVISIILFKKIPFENVVTTGTILAEDGSKMSKSKGNFPDPWLVIEKYGADSLRFYLMNSVVMQADNLNFSEKGVENSYRKVMMLLWNVYRYLETYVGMSASGGGTKKEEPGNILDAWIDIRAAELVRGVTKNLDAYDTVHATRLIQDYVNDLSTWYLRRSRKRKDKDFFATLERNLVTVSKIMAPFTPLFAEALYTSIVKGEKSSSVHLEDWPDAGLRIQKQDLKLLADMKVVRDLASAALAKRAEFGIKVRQPLQSLKVKNARLKIGKELLAILKDEINVKEIIFDAKLKEDFVLDTAITPALKEEGTLRELIRMVQDLRQDGGLTPKDKITLMLEVAPEVSGIAERNKSLFMKEVNATEILLKRSDKFDVELETKFDSLPMWIGMKKK